MAVKAERPSEVRASAWTEPEQDGARLDPPPTRAETVTALPRTARTDSLHLAFVGLLRSGTRQPHADRSSGTRPGTLLDGLAPRTGRA
ncbi:hypothetical protein ACFY00_37890 [Kitasatospora sp. NPDC001540]|uniref:hypothetical protein n=1 Tax=Kitasatospora sp. NPDC001540 TaxID=3364014 RepID=UPI00369AA4CB